MLTRINTLLQAGETSDAFAFIRELAQRVPQHEDELMTIAQQLEQKGRQDGVQEASLKIARNLLESGMDSQLVMKMTGLTEKELKQLRH